MTAFAVLAALMVVLGATPLGGAVARTVGGFSDWLSGEPGTSADESEQRRLWARWPERPELRELVRARVGEAAYVLYGFRTGETVCLRLTIRGIRRTGPETSCVPRHELERSRDLVIPVKGDVSFGHVGPLPRKASDPPTVPVAIATFGFAAGEAVRIDAALRDNVVIERIQRAKFPARLVGYDSAGRVIGVITIKGGA